MSRTILVTGARGFLGSSIVSQLVRFSENSIISSDLRQVQSKVAKNPRVREICLDVTETAEFLKAAESADVVVNVAGLSDKYNLYETVRRVNVDGSAAAVDAAEISRGGYLVHISSASVYGPALGTRYAAEDSPVAPVGCYAVSKAEGERHVIEALQSGRIHGVILRPFTVVGPGQRLPPVGTPPVLLGLVRAALGSSAFSIQGSGDQVRDYIGVSDVALAVAAAVESQLSSSCPVNLGTGMPTSILTLATLVERLSGRSIKAVLEYDVPASSAYIADTARMIATFELSPQSLAAVVSDTIDWMKGIPELWRLRPPGPQF